MQKHRRPKVGFVREREVAVFQPLRLFQKRPHGTVKRRMRPGRLYLEWVVVVQVVLRHGSTFLFFSSSFSM
jgi:hypothetical protein